MNNKSALVTGYIRVSTDEQVKKGFSPEVQQARIEEYIEGRFGSQPYEVRLFKDLAETGDWGLRQHPDLFRKYRAELSEAVDLLVRESEGRPVHLVCLDQSRLDRNPLVWEILKAKYFGQHNIHLHLVDEGGEVISTPESDFMRRISSAANANYRAQTSRRVKEAHQYRAHQGYLHCVPPYGWRRVPKEDGQRWHDIEPVPKQVVVVEMIKDKTLAGWGSWRICKWLESQGILSPNGKTKWYPQTVRDIVRNPIHAGFIRHGDECIKGQHYPLRLWDIELTDELDRLITQRHRAPKRGVRLDDFLLAGMLTCGYDGSALSSTYDSTTGKRYYRCTHVTASPSDYHPSINKLAEDVEITVVEEVRQVLSTGAIQDLTAERVEQLAEQEITQLRREEQNLAHNMDRLSGDLVEAISQHRAGELSDLAFQGIKSTIEKQMETVHEERQGVERRLRHTQTNKVRLERARDAARDFELLWQHLDTDERRGLLQALIEEIVVLRDGRDIKLVLKFHFLPNSERYVPRGLSTLGPDNDQKLTRREVEFFYLWSQGLSYDAMADRFDVGRSAPRQYALSGRRKLGVDSNDEAVKVAWHVIQEMKPYLHHRGRVRRRPKDRCLLSKGQQEVLQLLAQGLEYREVANRLGITLPSAYNKAYEARRKLQAKDNEEAIAKARELGLI